MYGGMVVVGPNYPAEKLTNSVKRPLQKTNRIFNPPNRNLKFEIDPPPKIQNRFSFSALLVGVGQEREALVRVLSPRTIREAPKGEVS